MGREETMSREMLQRMVVMLFALAGLANRASGRSYPVRLLVLSILRPAEIVAWNLVVREVYAHGASLRLPVWREGQGRDDKAEAIRLALYFRLIAMALNNLLARTWSLRTRCDRPQTASYHRPPQHARPVARCSQDVWALAAPDTS